MIRWLWRRWWQWRHPHVSPDNRLIHAYFYRDPDER
jgi:hypothetical protein